MLLLCPLERPLPLVLGLLSDMMYSDTLNQNLYTKQLTSVLSHIYVY
jgi:hypothetical protein